MQAKYRKNVVDIVLCNVLAPQKPASIIAIIAIIIIIKFLPSLCTQERVIVLVIDGVARERTLLRSRFIVDIS